jgi:thiosulfate/3-mercaptopyruvate sulfurtransferase
MMNHIVLQKPLIEARWLKDNLGASNLIIIDATLPKAVAMDAKPTTDMLQIPGARFLDIKGKFSSVEAPFPNTMLDQDGFNKAARELGLNNDTALIVYDEHGIYSSARAWWMFRSMGHRNVAVLNGGLKSWMQAGYPVEPIRTRPYTPGNFSGTFDKGFFKNYQQVMDTISNSEELVVDARANDRFKGLVEEPREGLRSGHIPNSVSLPYTDLLEDDKMLGKNQLRVIFEERLPENDKLVFSCGSGITACILALGAEIAGVKNTSVYDGSWTEWGSMHELPIEKG